MSQRHKGLPPSASATAAAAKRTNVNLDDVEIDFSVIENDKAAKSIVADAIALQLKQQSTNNNSNSAKNDAEHNATAAATAAAAAAAPLKAFDSALQGYAVKQQTLLASRRRRGIFGSTNSTQSVTAPAAAVAAAAVAPTVTAAPSSIDSPPSASAASTAEAVRATADQQHRQNNRNTDGASAAPVDTTRAATTSDAGNESSSHNNNSLTAEQRAAAAAAFLAEAVPETREVLQQKRNAYLSALRLHCCTCRDSSSSAVAASHSTNAVHGATITAAAITTAAGGSDTTSKGEEKKETEDEEGNQAEKEKGKEKEEEKEKEPRWRLSERYSLHSLLLADGVADIEPWDAPYYALPRYDRRALKTDPRTYRSPLAVLAAGGGAARSGNNSTNDSKGAAAPQAQHQQQQQQRAAALLVANAGPDALHTVLAPPALADSLYMRDYLCDAQYEKSVVNHGRNEFREMKTKAELREERKQRLKAKQAAAAAERERKKKEFLIAAAVTGAGGAENDASDGGDALRLAATAHSGDDRISNKTLLSHARWQRTTVSGATGREEKDAWRPLLSLNPIDAQLAVREAYEQRLREHLTRNHLRHVAAIPNQIARRERRVVRRATECPELRVYKLSPLQQQYQRESPAAALQPSQPSQWSGELEMARVSSASDSSGGAAGGAAGRLAAIRHYANDARLRGFVLWVGKCEAVIVLAGGAAALTHIDKWILHKMRWNGGGGSGFTEPQATRVCVVPLPSADCVSLRLPAARHGADNNNSNNALLGKKRGRQETLGAAAADGASHNEPGSSTTAGGEPVYMKFVDTPAEAEAFLSKVLCGNSHTTGNNNNNSNSHSNSGNPSYVKPQAIWADLSCVWRAAFLDTALNGFAS